MEDFEKFYQDLDINNFNNIKKKIDFIVKKTGKSEKEIIMDIQKLKRDFDTIITDIEAIIEIYMNQLGIKEDIKPESTFKKIKDLEIGDYVNLKGEVLSIRSSDKHSSLRLKDDTGIVRVVSFDPFKFLDIYEGNTITIYDALVKEGLNGKKEIVLNNRSKIEQELKVKYNRKNIKDIKEGDLVEIIAIVKKVFEPREVEREYEGKIFKKKVTTLILSDESGDIFAYLNFPFDKSNEAKTFLVRAKVFKSRNEDLRLGVSSLIFPNFELELEKLTKK